MKLFRTLNADCDPDQPLIQWEGDVRGIIAALPAREQPEPNAEVHLRVIRRAEFIPRFTRVKQIYPMESAA